jgi:hypothetical protein
MGLFVTLSISVAPRVMVELVCNHRLPALIDMNVLHRLHMAVCQPVQRFDGRTALRLRL